MTTHSNPGFASFTLIRVNFAYTRSHYWLRLTLRNNSDQALPRMLEISNDIASIRFHQPGIDGAYHTIATGKSLPFATRAWPNRRFVFPVALAAHSEQVIYLTMHSNTSLEIRALLWQPEAFHQYERSDYNRQMLYFGMSIAMSLFNLLLYLILRDAIYLLYVGFATFATLAVAARTGLGQEFLWPLATHWSSISVYFSDTICTVIFLLFTSMMLNLRQLAPTLAKLSNVLSLIHLLIALGFTVALQTLAKPAAIFNLMTALFSLGVSLFCMARRQRSA
jgi:hypothetical protein